MFINARHESLCHLYIEKFANPVISESLQKIGVVPSRFYPIFYYSFHIARNKRRLYFITVFIPYILGNVQ